MIRNGLVLLKQLSNLVYARYVFGPGAGRSIETPACRCCGSMRLQFRGKLPDAKVFAGTLLDQPLAGGQLYACINCSFVLRHPVLPKETYNKLYRAGNPTTWDEAERIDQDVVRAALLTFMSSGSVLDIGCGSGNLLQPLESGFDKYGIEINADAASIAAARGVNIIAHDLEQMSRLPQLFDAVIACDVIEHVANPLEFMQLLLSKTQNGGYVMISTGNAEAWSWRLLGSRFWYCFLPEHISFVSPTWFRRCSDELCVNIVDVREFVYSRGFSRMGKALRLSLMALFRLSPQLYYRLLPHDKRNNIPVGCGITRDHFLIVLRKLPVS